MADIEEELRNYALRRVGGNLPPVKPLIDTAVALYRSTLKAQARFGAGHPKWWKFFEGFCVAADDIKDNTSGDADYYLGPRQYDELVLPALQATRSGGCRPLAGQMSLVGDLIYHTHCDALSIQQQAAGIKELCRICKDPGLHGEFQMHNLWGVLNSAAKLSFLPSNRDAKADLQFDREHIRRYDKQLAAEAGRDGLLAFALQFLGGSGARPYEQLPGILVPPSGPAREEHDLQILYSAQCMARSLYELFPSDAAEHALFLARRPPCVRQLVQRLRNATYPEYYITMTRLLAQLGIAHPALQSALEAESLVPTVMRLLHLANHPEDKAEVIAWMGRFEAAAVDENAQASQPLTNLRRSAPEGGVDAVTKLKSSLAPMPVRELKAACERAGLDTSRVTEKGELVEMAVAAMMEGDGEAAEAARREIQALARQVTARMERENHHEAVTAMRMQGDEKAAEGAWRVIQEQALQTSAQLETEKQAQQAAQPVKRKEQTSKSCACCGAARRPDGGRLKVCAGCDQVRYCSRECQVKAWKQGHREACRAAAAAAAAKQGKEQQAGNSATADGAAS